jgi:hypothetical protein
MLNREECLGLSEIDVTSPQSHRRLICGAVSCGAFDAKLPAEARSVLAAFPGPQFELFEYINTEVLGELDREA